LAVDLGKLVLEVKQKIGLDELAGMTVAIDAYNTIYQFLSIIRQPDGTPLMDSKGRVTSHLSGLLYRTANLLEHDIRPIYVFDGIPPALKRRTLEARMSRREEALEEWEKAKAKGMVAEARTHAMASTRINKEIVQSSKELLGYMGIPFIQAPSEGEAQGAMMVRNKLVDAVASQDYDSFLFGADVVIRNLTITGRRKLPKKGIYIEVTPEKVLLKDLLSKLGIERRQLIWLGILMGTDFNLGIEGVGPVNALKIASSVRSVDELEAYVREKYKKEFDVDPREVEKIFMEPEVTSFSHADFSKIMTDVHPSKESMMKFMCEEHGFSAERIDKYADKFVEAGAKKKQKGMGSWL
jgi:flap endonuclease-1